MKLSMLSRVVVRNVNLRNWPSPSMFGQKELAKFEFCMWNHYLGDAVLSRMLSVCGGLVLPCMVAWCDHMHGHMLPSGYQGLQVHDQELPGYRNGKKSVFAWRE